MLRRLLNLFRPDHLECELREELEFHRSQDPVGVSVAVFLMAAVSLFAGYLPARRATQVDPMTALRHE